MAKKEEKGTTEPRWLDHVLTLELPQPAFAGPGHTAVQIIAAAQLQRTDPFVLLVDDRLDFIPGQQVGGPHPHAGFETVTWMLAGTLADHDEGLLQTGDIGWMTAGRGVIHGEDVRTPAGPARLLQLWIRLPEKDRAVPTRVEVIRGADVPVFRAPGVEALVYSGITNGLKLPTPNHVPVTLVDLRLNRHATFQHDLPASYNGLVLPLSGLVTVGSKATALATGQVGWLDPRAGDAPTVLDIRAEAESTRVLLIAGQRQNEPTVHRGPFVAGSLAALLHMHDEYAAGRFTRVSQL
jgi:redox-sensitive bicupin YhaK (pirin superfamily)